MVSNINVHIEDADYIELVKFKAKTNMTWVDLLLFHIGKKQGDGRTTRHKKNNTKRRG